jgi:uncharacterized protein YjbI with pentapeptide repeats
MSNSLRAGVVLALMAVVSAALGVSGASAQSVGVDCIEPLDLVSASQDLTNCNLKGVTIAGGSPDSSALRLSNLSGANMMDATISGAFALELSNLQGVNLQGATISGFLAVGGPNPVVASNVSGANLNGATISGFGAFPNANLTGSNLRGAVISGQFALPAANLTDANLAGALVSGQFAMPQVNLTRANLEGAVVTGLGALAGAIYNDTTCPDGTNSDDNGGTCTGHLTA